MAILARQEICSKKVCVCPKFLLTSLYDECGAIFLREEKSAAISLIPPRGPAPQTTAMGIADQSNRRVEEEGEGAIFLDHALIPPPALWPLAGRL